MSKKNKRRHLNVVIIDGTKHAKCEFCGKVEELRPYGPKGESVCFDCAMKDEAAARARFEALSKGKLVIIK